MNSESVHSTEDSELDEREENQQAPTENLHDDLPTFDHDEPDKDIDLDENVLLNSLFNPCLDFS